MYHDEMTASAAPTTGSPKDRHELAVADTWNLDDIYAERRRTGRRAVPRSKPASSGLAAPARARWPRAAPALLDGAAGSRRARPARLSRLLLRRAPLRPGPARQRRQRPAPARPAPAGAVGQATSWFNPELLAIPLATVQGWMRESDGAGALSLRASRTSTGSRSTCSTRRASGCWRCRRSSATPPTTATTRSPPPTPSSRPSRCRPAKRCRPPTRATARSSRPTASRRIAPRRSRRTTSRSPTTRTPTPRSTTACCSATGSTPRRAATRRCSTRRSTATPSRRRWSRT